MKAALVSLVVGACIVNARSNSSVLFSGGTVIAWDHSTEDLQVIRNGSVLVTGDSITAVFSGPYNGTLPTDTETIASNTSLSQYLLCYGEFASDGLWTPEQVYISQLAGLYEALNAGATTILDHAHNTWSNETTQAGLDATLDSGARVVWCPALHNVTNFTFADQIAKFKNLAEGDLFADTPVTLGLAYDGFNPGSPEQTAQVVELALKYKPAVITTHTLQGVWGANNSSEDLQNLGILNTPIPIVFSHASFLSLTGAQFLRGANQFVSITPESEMHYGHDHPHSHLIQDQAALGVDTHFTYSTDILTQARIWLQSVRQTLYRVVLDTWQVPSTNPMSVVQAFLLATRQGGLALRRPDLGVIRTGAKADVVIWNGCSPGMLGWIDPVAAVILHANVGDIKHVMVNGVFQKRNGSLTVENYPEIQERFLKAARDIQEVFRDIPYPATEGKYFTFGWRLQPTMRVDVERGEGDGYGEVYV
ncbi:hypothetical protein GE09DRAFT_1131069 [Coniochaeta sp. 2T2.1]|nr:hypothetical protein GE09DRAFT_1131069 [Coniochaeta sp. 2T2.1]